MRAISDTWEHGDPYERYVGRWSRRVAPAFLAWLALPTGRRWVDVGCGTGSLAGAILDHCAPASVVGVEPSEGFARAASANLAGRAEIRRGSATEIPLADASVDAAVSALVLNFLPDQPAALAEMSRVLVPGGTVGANVWDYAGKMVAMRLFWEAAVELDPAAAQLAEGLRFPSCRPDALVDLFTRAGLKSAEATAIDIDTPFANFDDYWQPFLGGQGPAPAYVVSLSESARARLRETIRARVPTGSDGSIPLVARAWAVRGITGKKP
jgi:SAM-dependent methyltransferase